MPMKMNRPRGCSQPTHRSVFVPALNSDRSASRLSEGYKTSFDGSITDLITGNRGSCPSRLNSWNSDGEEHSSSVSEANHQPITRYEFERYLQRQEHVIDLLEKLRISNQQIFTELASMKKAFQKKGILPSEPDVSAASVPIAEALCADYGREAQTGNFIVVVQGYENDPVRLNEAKVHQIVTTNSDHYKVFKGLALLAFPKDELSFCRFVADPLSVKDKMTRISVTDDELKNLGFTNFFALSKRKLAAVGIVMEKEVPNFDFHIFAAEPKNRNNFNQSIRQFLTNGKVHFVHEIRAELENSPGESVPQVIQRLYLSYT